jgi:hypothetical protein
VRLVGVTGGEQPGGGVVRLVGSPVLEALEVEVDVSLLALVHQWKFYHQA